MTLSSVVFCSGGDRSRHTNRCKTHLLTGAPLCRCVLYVYCIVLYMYLYPTDSMLGSSIVVHVLLSPTDMCQSEAPNESPCLSDFVSDCLPPTQRLQSSPINRLSTPFGYTLTAPTTQPRPLHCPNHCGGRAGSIPTHRCRSGAFPNRRAERSIHPTTYWRAERSIHTTSYL